MHFALRTTALATLTLSAIALPEGSSSANSAAVFAGSVDTWQTPSILGAVSTQGEDMAGNGQMAKGAQNFISNLTERALDFLANEKLSKAEQRRRFKDLLNDSFDMQTIGRFALGRYWRLANEQQREEYLKLFEKMVVDVYSSRFDEYKGQKLEIRGSRKLNEKDTLVSSVVLPDENSNNSQKVKVDWRVRYKDGQYQIIDVIVEGVSMSVTQRSDFSSVIQRGGGDIKALLKHLEKKYG